MVITAINRLQIFGKINFKYTDGYYDKNGKRCTNENKWSYAEYTVDSD